MFYLFDRAENLIKSINKKRVIEASQEESINSPDILRTIINEESINDAFYIGHKDVINKKQLCLYKIHSDNLRASRWEITGVESAYDDLLADGFIKDLRPTNQEIRTVLESLLNGSRLQVGNIYSNKKITTNFYYLSRLEAIQKMLEVSGTEVKFRLIFDGRNVLGRYVDIYDAIGEDRGQRFVHGSNLLHVVREEKRNGIYTALIGRGKGEEVVNIEGDPTGGYGRRILFSDVSWSKANGDPVDKPLGQDFVEIPEMTNAFGYPNGKPRIGIVEFTSIDDPEELLQATYDKLVNVSRPLVSYSADVKDIGDTGLGDVVSIIRKDIGIAYKTRINSREINLLEPTSVKVKLGDEVKDYRQTQLSNINNKIESSSGVIENLLSFVVSQYLGEDGYTYNFRVGNEHNLPAGLYSFDKPIDQTPTKVIYIGAGKMLIANEKNPDGSWNWITVATGDGFIADNMFAGSISADLIKGGMQKALNGDTNINWNTGDFNIMSNNRRLRLVNGTLFVYDRPTSPSGTNNEIFSIQTGHAGDYTAQLARLVKAYTAESIAISTMDADNKLQDYIICSGVGNNIKVESWALFYLYGGLSVYEGLNVGEIFSLTGQKRFHIQDGDTPIRLHGGTYVYGSFGVSGAKNAIVETENFGHRAVSAYETAEYYFGDIGSAKLKDGKCKIEIESIFAETVNTEVEYQVFLQAYGNANIWVSERNQDCFIVEGTDDIEFGWEIKAKRKGYEYTRLEEHEVQTMEELEATAAAEKEFSHA